MVFPSLAFDVEVSVRIVFTSADALTQFSFCTQVDLQVTLLDRLNLSKRLLSERILAYI